MLNKLIKIDNNNYLKLVYYSLSTFANRKLKL